MSTVGGLWRSFSEKVSQSIEDIKTKSNEASSDIARGMRGLRDSTKAGVEKIGTVLNISDSGSFLYEDVSEKAGFELAAHYSQTLGRIHSNNEKLVLKGKQAASEFQKVESVSNNSQSSLEELRNTSNAFPELSKSITDLQIRLNDVLKRIRDAEEALTREHEATLKKQFENWKAEKDRNLEQYKQKKDKEYSNLTQSVSKEHHELQATQFQKQMDEFVMYGFSAKSQPSSSSASTGKISTSSSLEQTSLINANLPNESTSELEEFLGSESASPAPVVQEEDEGPTIKIDTSTIEEPEL